MGAIITATETSCTLRLRRDRAIGRAARTTDPWLRGQYLRDAKRMDDVLRRREVESGRMF